MAATQISRNYSSILTFQSAQRLDHLSLVKTGLHMLPTASSRRISLVRASSKPQTVGGGGGNADDDDNNNNNNNNNNKATFISQEDVGYLVKLGGGSIAGAAAIKYGSVIFPEVTTPNLAQALFMIFAPVLVAVFILINQSRAVD